MITFFANVPLWVLPLFIGLVIISLRATRSRKVPKLLIYGLPLLGLLSLRTILSFDLHLLAIVLFALGYTVGTIFGFLAQAKWIADATHRHVTIRGEWLTMVTIMGMFLLNFVNGAVTGIAPDVAMSPIFVAGISAFLGVLSGTFFGRALRVMRFTNAPA